MPYPIKLEECCWTDIDAAVRDGYETVIIPTASLEQSCLHLPLITNILIEEELAARIAARLGKAFAAPVVHTGLAEHPMAFSGSMTPAWSAFVHTLKEVCLALAEHGFRYLVLISSHAGNCAAINQMRGMIQEHIWNKSFSSTLIACADLEQYTRWQQDILVNEMGGQREEAAGLVETAMMLALRPDLVHMECAAAARMGEQVLAGGPQLPGEPCEATAEMGKKLLDYLSGEMADEIRARILCRR